jgi:8-oxo-dGTP pyrophosphatase MutT (NUDIX family)
VAIWVAGRVLCVRQSYRRALSFPGGGIEPGEPPGEAARRELREELGLDVAAADLRHVFTAAGLWDGRHDTVWFHELHLAQAPALRPDRREVVATAFIDATRLEKLRVTGPVRAYLDWRAAQGDFPQA